MFGTKIKNVELYTSFRICAFPLRAQRQQSNLITPPNVWQKNQNRIKKLRKYKNTAFVFAPFGCFKNGWGRWRNQFWNVKPNIHNFIMISVPDIWGVEIYFWIAYKAQHFQFYPDICVKYLGVETYFWKMCTTQDFSFYPDIFAKICVCLGGAIQKPS